MENCSHLAAFQDLKAFCAVTAQMFQITWKGSYLTSILATITERSTVTMKHDTESARTERKKRSG